MTKEILDKMTLEQKVSICSGKTFWKTEEYEELGIPELFMCDGPHGLRKQEVGSDMLGVNKSRSATCFPAEVTTSGSFDTELLERIGRAIGEEAREQKVGLVLGPGANIKRNPLCGRNFEYFSEDPYLAGKLAAAFIRGVESQGVGTSLKHFACNSQEKDRFVSDGLVDERTLREIYLTGFETAVKEGKPATLMCAYPKLNGTHCSDHKELLTDILRDEWGFEGLVVTDWGAMNDRMEAFRAGCDLNMPGCSAYMEQQTVAAVRSGELDEEYVNRTPERVLNLVLRGAKAMTGESCDYDAHHALCEEAALSGAVLLQNEDQLLPLKKEQKIAIIGDMAKHMRYQGAGSSHINATKLSQPMELFSEAVYSEGVDERGNATDLSLKNAVKAAQKADVAVVFAGLPDRYESEGFDRDDLKMPEGHVALIEAVAEANPNTVVVLMCGSAVECPWADKVKSILYMGLPGQAGGSAMYKLLYGEVSPSGRLTESWPVTYEDVPSSEIFGKTTDALYEEGLYVGYRYYEKAGKPVRWSFGHGLSYTSFTYSDLSVCGDTVKVTVTNTGAMAGKDAVLLYVKAPQDGLHRPVRELKGFTKVSLEPGQSKEVTFTLNERSFSVYQDGWKVPKGTYEICVGELTASVEKDGEVLPAAAWQSGSFYEKCEGKPVQSQWEAMYGKAYVPAPKLHKGQFTMECTVEEMAKESLIMKIMAKSVERVFRKGLGKRDPDDPELRMMITSSIGSPLRSMYISSCMAGGLFPGLLEMANGHLIRGIKKMLEK